jgi:hypothetical protein
LGWEKYGQKFQILPQVCFDACQNHTKARQGLGVHIGKVAVDPLRRP